MYGVCTWAQDERPAHRHMAQLKMPVSRTVRALPVFMYGVRVSLSVR
jgi:hypothetical protein